MTDKNLQSPRSPPAAPAAVFGNGHLWRPLLPALHLDIGVGGVPQRANVREETARRRRGKRSSGALKNHSSHFSRRLHLVLLLWLQSELQSVSVWTLALGTTVPGALPILLVFLASPAQPRSLSGPDLRDMSAAYPAVAAAAIDPARLTPTPPPVILALQNAAKWAGCATRDPPHSALAAPFRFWNFSYHL